MHVSGSKSRVFVRSFSALVVLGACFATSAEVRGEDVKQACFSAHEEAQVLRKKGELRMTRDKLRFCARGGCPQVVQGDCVEWLGEVEKSIPSVVLEAHIDDRDAVDVKVMVDGTALATRLDGNPIELDAGEHVFRFETEGQPPIEQRVVIKVGEKNRVVSVQFGTKKAAPGLGNGPVAAPSAPAKPRPIPTSVWVLGGVGAAGLLAGGVFMGLGLSQRSCKPFCSDSDTSAIKTKFLIADIGIGVGIVGIASALVLYATRPEVEGSVEKTEKPPETSGALGFGMLPGGGLVQWARPF